MKKTILTIRRFNNYLIHILSVIFSIKNKKLIINNLRKYSLHIIGTIFVYLLYLSLPFIFNSEIIKKELSLNIIKEYKVKLKISDNIKYSIFPSPHFKIKNSLLFINDNENEIAKIKETKIFISTLNLHNSKKIKISKVVFNESNFILKKKNLKSINDYFKNKISKKKIIIKNSKIFYKDKKNQTIAIVSINNLNLFFDDKLLINRLIFNGKQFNIPFNAEWNKNFDTFDTSKLDLKLNHLGIKIKNTLRIDKKKYFGVNILNLHQNKIKTKYSYEDDLLIFSSESKNKNISFKGRVNFKPFYFNVNTEIFKLNFDDLINDKSIIMGLLKNDLLNHKNLNGSLFVKIEKILKNKLFENAKLNIVLDNSIIKFDKTYFKKNDLGKLNLFDGKIFLNKKNEYIFNSKFSYIIANQKKFYRLFQIPKKNRILLNDINFQIEKNLNTNILTIKNLEVNHKKNNHPTDQIITILKDFNKNDKEIKTWINLKSFINKIFQSYSG